VLFDLLAELWQRVVHVLPVCALVKLGETGVSANRLHGFGRFILQNVEPYPASAPCSGEALPPALKREATHGQSCSTVSGSSAGTR
jgi:hypothetical protein